MIRFSTILQPTDNRFYVASTYTAPILVSQQILENDFHGEW